MSKKIQPVAELKMREAILDPEDSRHVVTLSDTDILARSNRKNPEQRIYLHDVQRGCLIEMPLFSPFYIGTGEEGHDCHIKLPKTMLVPDEKYINEMIMRYNIPKERLFMKEPLLMKEHCVEVPSKISKRHAMVTRERYILLHYQDGSTGTVVDGIPLGPKQKQYSLIKHSTIELGPEHYALQVIFGKPHRYSTVK